MSSWRYLDRSILLLRVAEVIGSSSSCFRQRFRIYKATFSVTILSLCSWTATARCSLSYWPAGKLSGFNFIDRCRPESEPTNKVSDLPCFRDFIDEGQTGYYFDHRGADAAYRLSKVVRAAILNREQTSQMSIEAVRKAANFSYDQIGSLYLDDFEKLLSTSNLESHRVTELDLR